MTEASRQEFTPECLTLFVNNKCNMRCRYCYSLPGADNRITLSDKAVREAARLVAGMCEKSNNPFTIVFHGGGEPTLNPRQVDRLLGIAQAEADRFGLQPRTYIATNGVVSEKTACWLANRFDLVGVSCDGPPKIQDRNRPGREGQPLSGYVERTLSILKRSGKPFHVRVTITRDTLNHQAEIVSYLADRYAPAEIRIEPVYSNPTGEATLELSHAASFVEKFLAAQTAGVARGIQVTTSITRPGAVYGPYCNVLRHVLNLVPGDVSTGCFLYSRPEDIARHDLRTGWLDSTLGVFRMDVELIRSLVIRCSKRFAGCEDCLCSCQCTYGCPDRCVLETSGSHPFQNGELGIFRCVVNRMLMECMIHEAADEAWAHSMRGNCREVRDTHRMLGIAVYQNNQQDEVEL
jgi:uncharacterized protein